MSISFDCRMPGAVTIAMRWRTNKKAPVKNITGASLISGCVATSNGCAYTGISNCIPYLQLMQVPSSFSGVPVFLLIHFIWSTGAKYLPHLSQACILKLRPQIFRLPSVASIRICSVGQIYAHAPHPIQAWESSTNGGPTFLSLPLPDKPMALTPTTSSQALTQSLHRTHFPLSVSG